MNSVRNRRPRRIPAGKPRRREQGCTHGRQAFAGSGIGLFKLTVEMAGT